MSKPLTLTERVQFMISEGMAAQIDAYRRQHPGPIPNRSEACRQLLELGLQAVKARKARGKG